MTRRLDGIHAVVTGGARGIGAAVSRQLTDAGAHVTLIGRNRARLDAHAARLGRAHVQVADITDETAIERAVRLAIDHAGPIGILVNNAGQAESAPATRTDSDLWRRMIDVNLTGTWLATRAALPSLLEAAGTSGSTGARIVNIASTAGLTGYAYVSAYCAAKHGVIGLTRALAVELARKHVTVNAVCPGFTDTDLLADAVRNITLVTGRSEHEARAELANTNPQGRLVQPDEVAHAVLSLCLPSAGAITGQAIAIAGGEVLTG